ncbi:MAG: hypothetical protein ACK55I_25935, partial [bacterium]
AARGGRLRPAAARPHRRRRERPPRRGLRRRGHRGPQRHRGPPRPRLRRRTGSAASRVPPRDPAFGAGATRRRRPEGALDRPLRRQPRRARAGGPAQKGRAGLGLCPRADAPVERAMGRLG